MSSLQPKDGSFDSLQWELELMLRDTIAAATALAAEKTTEVFTSSNPTPRSMHQDNLRSYQAGATHNRLPRQGQDNFVNAGNINKHDGWPHAVTDGNRNDSTPRGNIQGQAYQLQQWAYENREQELTVTEKLEMSKWEHDTCMVDDWSNIATNGRDAAVFKETVQGLSYQLQQWACETRHQELTVAEMLEKSKLEHDICEDNGLSHMGTDGNDET